MVGLCDAQRAGERQAATMVNCGTVLPDCPLDLKLDGALPMLALRLAKHIVEQGCYLVRGKG